MHFTDSRSVGQGIVTEFSIKNSADGLKVWDVTDPFSPETVRYTKKVII